MQQFELPGDGWCGHDLVKENFNRDRFEAILSNLHFADPDDRPEPIEEGSERLNPADRNWKMDPVLKLFIDAWKAAAELTQYLAMDESMIKYRGRMDPRKQRIATKPIKNGLKAFVLAGALEPVVACTPPARCRNPHCCAAPLQVPLGLCVATCTI